MKLCGRCGELREERFKHVCKQCQEDEKTTQWGRG